MSCQLLLVGHKEIYWILPKHHISWCPVTKQHHWNLFVNQRMWSFSRSKFRSTNKWIFTHWFIHLLIHLKCLLASWSRISSMLLRSSQWYVPFYGRSEEEAFNSFSSNLEIFLWGFEILSYLSAKENKPLLILITADLSFKANNTESIVLARLPSVYS